MIQVSHSDVQRRLRDDLPEYELRNARVRTARKPTDCVFCQHPILVGDTYARITETRLPVCQLHFTPDDIVEVTRA
jgi:hypothetical protein